MIKSALKIAGLGVVALGLFVSCQKEVNPTYDPQTKTVNAQFVLNIAADGAGQTKMASEKVQAAGNFLGINKCKIITYATGGSHFVNSTNGTGYRQYYNFPDLMGAGAVNSTNSRRILEVSLDTGTDAVLVYGKAINSNPGNETGTCTGAIDAKVLSNTHFDAVRRLTDEAKYNATAKLMIFAINNILASKVEAKDALPALTWAELGHQYEINHTNPYNRKGTYAYMNALEEILGQTYASLTYIKTKTDGTPEQNNQGSEYRAGSSGAVKKWMTDADKVLTTVRNATPSDDAEKNAKRLATEIERVMGIFFTNSWEYETVDNIRTAVVGTTFDEYNFTDASAFNAYFPGVADDALRDYPHAFGIPVGAAQLAFDSTKDRFSYKNPNAPLVNPNMTAFAPDKYYYPVELYYYVNSPIRTTDYASLAQANFANTTAWDGDWSGLTATWTPNGTVSSSTRGVAVQYSLNYGVAMLETNVQYAADITSFQDNKAHVTGDPSNNVFTSLNLNLRGVLVGGQNPQVNWQFLRKDNTLFDNVIYDDAPADVAVPSVKPNYTLVFDNYDSGATNGQNDVYVALEFINMGDGFYGRDNYIPTSGIFYLVGKLEASPAGQTITWPTNNQIPPLYGVDGEEVPAGKTAGQSKQIPRVFIQDFVTKATFRIGETSLQKAYLTIPDLRTAQMSLGLSVDLTWQSGYSYDIAL